MDVLSIIGGAGSSGAYPDPVPAAIPSAVTPPPSAPPVTSAPVAAVSKPAIPYSPAVSDAPSPTPASIVNGVKQLPLDVQYAPSSAPRIGSAEPHFDRSA